jgi:hypothetical protein
MAQKITPFSDETYTPPPDPVTHILSVALVSEKFRDLLLTDPERALNEGEQGQPFPLAPADRKRILAIEADSLEALAAQIAQTYAKGTYAKGPDAEGTDVEEVDLDIHLQANSPVPLYRQLYTHLQQSIEQGTLAMGTQLPSERRLAAIHGISRLTARRAYQLLKQEGYVVAQRGSGSFVMWRA